LLTHIPLQICPYRPLSRPPLVLFICARPVCGEGLKPEKLYNDDDVKSRYVLPYKISGKKELTLFAVWTKGKDRNGTDIRIIMSRYF
jgi:hypothetical protein